MTDEILTIPLVAIDVAGRLREIDLDEVEKLALSFKEAGQITPVEVRKTGADIYVLVAGAHRIAAARRLGQTTIRAVLFSGDDDTARLREIDENLYRRELSPFDQAEFLEERRQVWERMHGTIRRGGDRRSKVQVAPLIEEVRRGAPFVRETVQKFNLSRDTIKRAFARKAQIDATVWAAIRGTKAAENGALLDRLRKLDFETQRAVLDQSRERGCDLNVALSIMKRTDRKPVEFPLLAALERGWSKAGDAERAEIALFIKNNLKGDAE